MCMNCDGFMLLFTLQISRLDPSLPPIYLCNKVYAIEHTFINPEDPSELRVYTTPISFFYDVIQVFKTENLVLVFLLQFIFFSLKIAPPARIPQEEVGK